MSSTLLPIDILHSKEAFKTDIPRTKFPIPDLIMFAKNFINICTYDRSISNEEPWENLTVTHIMKPHPASYNEEHSKLMVNVLLSATRIRDDLLSVEKRVVEIRKKDKAFPITAGGEPLSHYLTGTARKLYNLVKIASLVCRPYTAQKGVLTIPYLSFDAIQYFLRFKDVDDESTYEKPAFFDKFGKDTYAAFCNAATTIFLGSIPLLDEECVMRAAAQFSGGITRTTYLLSCIDGYIYSQDETDSESESDNEEELSPEEIRLQENYIWFNESGVEQTILINTLDDWLNLANKQFGALTPGLYKVANYAHCFAIVKTLDQKAFLFDITIGLIPIESPEDFKIAAGDLFPDLSDKKWAKMIEKDETPIIIEKLTIFSTTLASKL